MAAKVDGYVPKNKSGSAKAGRRTQKGFVNREKQMVELKEKMLKLEEKLVSKNRSK